MALNNLNLLLVQLEIERELVEVKVLELVKLLVEVIKGKSPEVVTQLREVLKVDRCLYIREFQRLDLPQELKNQ